VKSYHGKENTKELKEKGKTVTSSDREIPFDKSEDFLPHHGSAPHLE
ncbi:unnamed protein product, partial [marine sediment metagenome]